MDRQQLKKKKVAVLMGGLSAERDVSLRTGAAVLAALQEAGYDACRIDAGRDLPARLLEQEAEVAFIALHGRYGEDGTVQGLLEVMGIPYTGSGVLASSLAMDKVATKKLLQFHGVSTPPFVTLRRGEDPAGLAGRCPLPAVVKPAREGSTIGVSIVKTPAQFAAGIAGALEHDNLVLVEAFIDGIEVTVSVLDGKALSVIQVVPEGGFYDYSAKYTAGKTTYLLPAPLEPEVTRSLQEAACLAYEALDCRGAARVDFMVRDGEIFCLEVNTIPGMTETSLLPKAAAEAGISFGELVQRILEDADLGK